MAEYFPLKQILFLQTNDSDFEEFLFKYTVNGTTKQQMIFKYKNK